MKTAISIHNLSVVREKNAILHQLSVDLTNGQVIGLLGPSGSGKTTLIRTIVGRQTIADGNVIILGQPAGSAPLRALIGYMPQLPASYLDLTVRQNLDYFAAMQGADRHAVTEVIHAVDLEHRTHRLVQTLSGGERSRVSLAIALLGNPPILVLDEPTVGVDPVLRQQLWQLFKQLAANGTTVLLSSHVMDEADRCDELLLIRDGRLIFQGTPELIKTHTHSSTVEHGFMKLVGADV